LDALWPQPLETVAIESATSAVDHPRREEFIGRTYSERGALAMCDGSRTWQGHDSPRSFIWNELGSAGEQRARRCERKWQRNALVLRRFRST
jgi:hypothetical protein